MAAGLRLRTVAVCALCKGRRGWRALLASARSDPAALVFASLLQVCDQLGFTFSFPLQQEGLAIGRLVKWTKGFNCEGVEGEDASVSSISFAKNLHVCAL